MNDRIAELLGSSHLGRASLACMSEEQEIEDVAFSIVGESLLNVLPVTFSGDSEAVFNSLVDDGIDERFAKIIAFGGTSAGARAGWATRRAGGSGTANKTSKKATASGEGEFWAHSPSRAKANPIGGSIFGPKSDTKTQAVKQVADKVAAELPKVAAKPGMMDKIKSAAGKAIDAGIHAAKTIGAKVGAAAKVAGQSVVDGIKEGVGASSKIVGGIAGVSTLGLVGRRVLDSPILTGAAIGSVVTDGGSTLEGIAEGAYRVGHAIGAVVGSPIGAAVGGTVGAIKGVGKGIKSMLGGE